VSGDELAGRVLCGHWLEALSRVLDALQQVLVVQMHDFALLLIKINICDCINLA
jgi:hypothetical protein